MQNKSDSESMTDQPLVRHAISEAKWISLVWLVAFVWVIGYCSCFGYVRDQETITTVCGMPSWVFWGVALPWAIATVASSWFALFCITDEPLTEGPLTEGPLTEGPEPEQRA